RDDPPHNPQTRCASGRSSRRLRRNGRSEPDARRCVAQPTGEAIDRGRMSPFELCLASAGPAGPDELWRSWSLAPETTGPLAVAFAWMLARRTHFGWVAFAGWLAFALALASPLCRLAATTASAHMVQHILLVAVAPALLALGWRRTRPPASLGRPTAASALYAAAIWLAHRSEEHTSGLQSRENLVC